MEQRISDLEKEVIDLERQLKLEKAISESLRDELDNPEPDFILEGVHANNRTQTAIEELFDNLDYIPIAEIENFINTHKKI